MRQNSKFSHESIQDGQSIRDILVSITEGLANEKLVFSDEDGDMIMVPAGLMRLKLTATKEENLQRINLRISWQVAEKPLKKDKHLSVRGSAQ